jgi:hypothetical protein
MDLNFRKLHLLAFGLVALAACETIVDIEVPIEKSQIVMNSLVNPDSAWSVNLTFSENVLAKDTVRFIDNAEVTVLDHNDQVVARLQYGGRGYYKNAESKPEAGSFYKILAFVPGYNTVEGSTIVPTRPYIVDATSRLHLFNSKLSASYTVEFQDDPSKDNYYEVFMEEVLERNDDSIHITHEYYPLYIQSDDPSINTEILDLEVGLMFKDRLFNGKIIKLHLISHEGVYGPNLISNGTRVLVRSTSKEYYEYATTLKLQFKASSDPLSQPVEVRSNIKNGLGLVAGVAQSQYIIPRPIPRITAISLPFGKRGDVIAIHGENLDGEFSNTVVYFNIDPTGNFSTFAGHKRVSAQIVERSPTRLLVVVPTAAITNRIIIHAFGTMRRSEENFRVIE